MGSGNSFKGESEITEESKLKILFSEALRGEELSLCTTGKYLPPL